MLATLAFPGALVSDASRNGFGMPEAVPVSYLVDAQGIVRDKFVAVDEGLLDEVVTPLLKKSPVTAIPAGMRQ